MKTDEVETLEQWLKEDAVLFDVPTEQLIEGLIKDGYDPFCAIKLIEDTQGVSIMIN